MSEWTTKVLGIWTNACGAMQPLARELNKTLEGSSAREVANSSPEPHTYTASSSNFELNVDEIEDTEWDETPYNKLVLPEGEKEPIMAFADRPRLNSQGFDDFIAHKGEGIMILLCGPPGVGKILTAEAMEEKSRVPLYIPSASDLETSPERVKAGLSKALECCQLWDAILLLDEVDVFLETRGSNSLDRNELVFIFLRRLEYYQGLIFLTTNHLSAIDPAFRSRFDLILLYRDIDEPSRRKI
ncbi:hypothetical protein AYL99_03116 [Fonsecaea erecta]|uniref:AAA+ ATPase domain-containing protein n=1 Tax=Fonsecaea erecta TaxID=1367422 RepID=A0A178ZVT2_9EURO|nr:hypothetical protein AYL99_03116 [Fonsecaea erecta]OAP63889.1 hypothetical protein AYL99_03116 [Fonsecaea erecta]